MESGAFMNSKGLCIVPLVGGRAAKPERVHTRAIRQQAENPEDDDS